MTGTIHHFALCIICPNVRKSGFPTLSTLGYFLIHILAFKNVSNGNFSIFVRTAIVNSKFCRLLTYNLRAIILLIESGGKTALSLIP